MNEKKEKNRKIMIIILIIIMMISLGFLVIKTMNKDYIMYRTYTKETGWSKWSKNGQTSGDMKYDILNIQIKVKSKDYGEVFYRTYSVKEEWSGQKKYDTESKNQKINAIRSALSEKLNRKNIIYYRTYNSKDGWLDWASDGEISGNKDETIKAIQISILPKDANKKELLKDYNKNKNSNTGF